MKDKTLNEWLYTLYPFELRKAVLKAAFTGIPKNHTFPSLSSALLKGVDWEQCTEFGVGNIRFLVNQAESKKLQVGDRVIFQGNYEKSKYNCIPIDQPAFLKSGMEGVVKYHSQMHMGRILVDFGNEEPSIAVPINNLTKIEKEEEETEVPEFKEGDLVTANNESEAPTSKRIPIKNEWVRIKDSYKGSFFNAGDLVKIMGYFATTDSYCTKCDKIISHEAFDTFPKFPDVLPVGTKLIAKPNVDAKYKELKVVKILSPIFLDGYELNNNNITVDIIRLHSFLKQNYLINHLPTNNSNNLSTSKTIENGQRFISKVSPITEYKRCSLPKVSTRSTRQTLRTNIRKPRRSPIYPKKYSSNT